MSELYSPPFYDIEPKRTENKSAPPTSSLTDSFIDLVRLIRAFIYSHMKVLQESCEVPEIGMDKRLDKELREYLQRTKNMNKNHVSAPGFTHFVVFSNCQFLKVVSLLFTKGLQKRKIRSEIFQRLEKTHSINTY